MKTRYEILLVLVAICSLLPMVGCTHSYMPPGPKAELSEFAPASIQAGFDRKPTYPYPAAIAVVRLQGRNYSNYHLRENGGEYGEGDFSVILTKEVEEDSQIKRISILPGVAGIVSLNRMLLPRELNSDHDLRVAASKLQADMLFLYTFDTGFYEKDYATPLSVVTLGLSPSRRIKAITTVSGMLMDTRTGYIYAMFEATEKADTLSSAWDTADNADHVRRKTEQAAFENLVGEFETTWPKLLASALEAKNKQKAAE